MVCSNVHFFLNFIFAGLYRLSFYHQGLYAMSINCMEAAESQFKTALMVRTLFCMITDGYL